MSDDEKGVWRVVATFNDKTPLNDKKISLNVEITTLNDTIFA